MPRLSNRFFVSESVLFVIVLTEIHEWKLYICDYFLKSLKKKKKICEFFVEKSMNVVNFWEPKTYICKCCEWKPSICDFLESQKQIYDCCDWKLSVCGNFLESGKIICELCDCLLESQKQDF